MMDRLQDDFEALQCAVPHHTECMRPENGAEPFVEEQILILIGIFSSQSPRLAQRQTRLMSPPVYGEMPPPKKYIRKQSNKTRN